MSIINDALKKTQNKLQDAAKKNPGDVSDAYRKLYMQKDADPKAPEGAASGAPAAHGVHGKPKEVPVKAKKAWHQTILTFVCVFLMIGGILATVLFVLVKKSSSTTFSGVISSLKLKGSKGRNSFAPRDPNAVKLDGIIASGGKRAALINGEVYEAGETINGKKILSISENRIELLGPNGTETLTVR